MFCLGPAANAGGTLALAGSIMGEVKSVAGVVEMGAKVMLYDRHDQMVRQVLTNEQGRFAFAALSPDGSLDSSDAGEFRAGAAAQHFRGGGHGQPAANQPFGNFQHGGHFVLGIARDADGGRLEVGAEGIFPDASDSAVSCRWRRARKTAQQFMAVRRHVFADRGHCESVGGRQR